MADSEKRTEPILCVAGCGFYGNPSGGNLCSKCAREKNSAEEQISSSSSPTPSNITTSSHQIPPSSSVSSPPPTSSSSIVEDVIKPKVDTPSLATTITPSSSTITSTTITTDTPTCKTATSTTLTEKPSKPKKARCFLCRKKTGMLGFQCRCGENFCSAHRHADQHTCSFDYKTADRAVLAKQNQAVVGDKLNRV